MRPPRDPGDLAVRALGVAVVALLLGAPWIGLIAVQAGHQRTALWFAAHLARSLGLIGTLPGRALDPGADSLVRVEAMLTLYDATRLGALAAIGASGLALALAGRRRFPRAAAIAATAGAGSAAAEMIEAWIAGASLRGNLPAEAYALVLLATRAVACAPLAAGALGLALARRRPRAARAILGGAVVVALAAAFVPDGKWPMLWGARAVAAAFALALALELRRGLHEPAGPAAPDDAPAVPGRP